jgi:transcriptional regulator with PAS, ATPase and Fis domain
MQTGLRVPQRELDPWPAYDWPGNVRESPLVVERAVILVTNGGARNSRWLGQGPPAATMAGATRI